MGKEWDYPEDHGEPQKVFNRSLTDQMCVIERLFHWPLTSAEVRRNGSKEDDN
jgi:hypothetical protein